MDVKYQTTKYYGEAPGNLWDGLNEICTNSPLEQHNIPVLFVASEHIDEYKPSEIDWMISKGLVERILEELPDGLV